MYGVGSCHPCRWMYTFVISHPRVSHPSCRQNAREQNRTEQAAWDGSQQVATEGLNHCCAIGALKERLHERTRHPWSFTHSKLVFSCFRLWRFSYDYEDTCMCVRCLNYKRQPTRYPPTSLTCIDRGEGVRTDALQRASAP